MPGAYLYSEEDNRRLFDIDFWGVVNGSLVAPHLTADGALIKHAVKGFTDALPWKWNKPGPVSNHMDKEPENY
jgi:hypothetical protein